MVKERVTGELKKAFKPEFLNRVDEVIVFHDLHADEIEQIVDIMVDRLRDQLMLQGFGITLSPEARKMLAAEGFDPTLGARPLRRAIQRLLEDPLSEQILAGNWVAGDVIEVFVEDDRPAFRKGEGPVAVPAKLAVAADDAPRSRRCPSGAAPRVAAGPPAARRASSRCRRRRAPSGDARTAGRSLRVG